MFVLALLFLWPGLEHFSGLADEGIDLYWADRIARGQLAYRDFFMFLPPLTPAWIAACFKLIGNCVLTARLWFWLVRAGCVLLSALLARRLMRTGPAVVASLLVMATTPEPTNYLHHWSGSFFFLLGLLVLDWSATSASACVGLLLGVSLSCCWLTMPNFAAALAAAMLVSQLVQPRWRQAPPVVLGIVLGILPWLGDLTRTGFRAQVIDYNLAREKLDHTPLSADLHLFAMTLQRDPGFWLLLVALAIALFGTPWLARRQPRVLTLYAACLASVAVMAYRFMPFQVTIHTGACLILACWVLGRLPWRAPLGLLALATLVWLGTELAPTLARTYPIDFPRGRLYSYRQEAADQIQLVKFLGRRSRGQPYVMVLPYLPNLYYLMGFDNPIPYDTWVPAYHGWRNEADYQNTLREILARPPGVIFVFPSFQTEIFHRLTWPSADPAWMAAQYARLDQWLHDHFRREDHGAVVLYLKR
jgi:hypothetical protein